MRYGYKVFAPYRAVRKVTVFGSARTPPRPRDLPAPPGSSDGGWREGWMVITGAGAGIMGAAQEGAGGERASGSTSACRSSRTPTPGSPPIPSSSPSSTSSRASCSWCGSERGGVLPRRLRDPDEGFELMTLIQTGKSPAAPGHARRAGRDLLEDVRRRSCGGRWWAAAWSSPSDPDLYRITDDVELAAAGSRLLPVYHSQRYVRDALVLRIRGAGGRARRPQRALHRHPERARRAGAGAGAGRGGRAAGPAGLVLPFNRCGLLPAADPDRLRERR